MLVVTAIFIPLRTSRIMGLSLVRLFDEAVPREDPRGILPTNVRLFRRPLRPFVALALVQVAVILPTSLLWEPHLIAGPMWVALDWTSKAIVAGHWERRHDVMLWQGHDRNHPERFSYTPFNPTPPTRTATDAPPW